MIFFLGLDFGTSCARISKINPKKESRFSNLVNYKYVFKNQKLREIRERIINIPIVSSKKTTLFGTALLAIDAKK